MIYIGSENIITPLGNSAEENFAQMSQGTTSVEVLPKGVNGEPLGVSCFSDDETYRNRVFKCVEGSFDKLSLSKQDSFTLIVCSTKGEIENLKGEDELYSLADLAKQISEKHPCIEDYYTISNACVSGISGVISGSDAIRLEKTNHVIVVGADKVSDFTLAGFQSFFAISDEVCKPYDKNRKGINLGEGCASIILSNSKEIFKEECAALIGGSNRNDANHISGPSRTGEGLFRSIQTTLNEAGVESRDVDFICSHGTATAYNDEMECQAFKRLDLTQTPMHSLKGYVGHTLGASGVIEIGICLQMIKHQKAIASFGYSENGLTHALNVQEKMENQNLNLILKSGSGFGGLNASILLKKL